MTEITGQTLAEVYDPAMAITDQAEADAYFAALVDRHLADRPEDGRGEAERVQRDNLGYYAGYFSHETRQRVERLFRCCHPFFGPAGEQPFDPERAVEIGLAIGARLRQ